MYRLASQMTAHYYKNPSESILYHGKDLVVHLVFRTEQEVGAAISMLQQMGLEQRQSPLHGKLSSLRSWNDNVKSCYSRDEIGDLVFLSDYVATESDSPPWSFSEHSYSENSASILHEATNPQARRLVTYQRIGRRSVFGQEKCHLISKRLCEAEATLSKYVADENNLLAMERKLHQAFDGILTPDSIPILLLEYMSTGDTVLAEGDQSRTEVKVRGWFLHSDARFEISPILEANGTELTPHYFTTTVHVLRPDVFAWCLNYKARETLEQWKDYGYKSVVDKIRLADVEEPPDP